jgi:gamma-glutamylcyclotransferase (GGCT)/AIG2-like uncharacterized protein YtfP
MKGKFMTPETARLFVYGTLMPNAGNHYLIEPQVRSAQPGTIKGVLIDLGSFPALVPGDGIVEGILLEIDSPALAITDHLESVPHFYYRRRVTVHLQDGEEIEAWTYEHADPARLVGRPPLIVGYRNGQPVHAWRSFPRL